MIDYKFLYPPPASKAEYMKLLDQAFRMTIALNKQLDEIGRILNQEDYHIAAE